MTKIEKSIQAQAAQCYHALQDLQKFFPEDGDIIRQYEDDLRKLNRDLAALRRSK